MDFGCVETSLIMADFTISYRTMCNLLFDSKNAIEPYLRANYLFLSDDNISEILVSINKRFYPYFKEKLKAVHYKKETFFSKYETWLFGEFSVQIPHTSDANSDVMNTSHRGRPSKDFDDCCDRSKRAKVNELRSLYPQAHIDAASSTVEGDKKKFEPDLVLSLITQAKLSKFQYWKILEAKRKCYPQNMIVTETSAEVPLQDLLDHTTERLFKTITVDWNTVIERNFTLQTKWGYDGASGQNEFAQKFSAVDASDPSLFMTSIVPLQLTVSSDSTNLIWKNPHASSTRLCRALKFELVKETPEVIMLQKRNVEDQIKELHDSEINIGPNVIKVKHILYFTMLDGKVVQAITGTPNASNCVACGAKPSEMNNLSKVTTRLASQEAGVCVAFVLQS